MYRPKKFLGQNFLVDKNIAAKIVGSLGIKQSDTVIEIGPGQGALTGIISGMTKNFYAVEIDRSICEMLKEKFPGGVNLIHKDFLKFDFAKDIARGKGNLKIIGNIPYNITTEILFKLLDSETEIDSAVLMMQHEVARRITASPSTKDYGILAVRTQLSSSPEILFRVPPQAFFPKPRVYSAVVRISFGGKKYSSVNESMLKELIRESFSQRRKTMSNSLKKFFEKYDIARDEVDFDFSRRAESLSPEEFVSLSGSLSRHRGK